MILIRHGDPDYKNDTLTEKGWREANLLGPRVARWQIDDFYTSPLGRAKDTAAPALKLLDRTAEVLPWAKEFSGYILDPETGNRRIPWDFLPSYWTQVPEYYNVKTWQDPEIMHTGDTPEVYQEMCDGIDALFAKYGYIHKDGYYEVTEDANREARIVLFCHFGITCYMLGHILNISPILLLQGFFTPPTGITILASEELEKGTASFRIQTLGDTAHLKIGGEPVSPSGYFAPIFQEPDYPVQSK